MPYWYYWVCIWFIISLSFLLLAIIVGRKTGGLDLSELMLTLLCTILWPAGMLFLIASWISDNSNIKTILSHEDLKRKRTEGFDK